MEAVFAICTAIISLSGLSFLLGPKIKRDLALRRSANWPTITAKITSTSDRTFDARGVPIWWVDYAYEIDGIKGSGRMTYTSQRLLSESGTVTVQAVYKVGESLLVRYDPKNPRISVAIGNPTPF